MTEKVATNTMMSTNLVSFMKKIVKGSAGDEEFVQRPTKPTRTPVVQENPSGRPSPKDLKHLTSEEKHILQRVWEKEEEFEQETQRLKVNNRPEVVEKYVKQPCRICRKMLEPNEKSYMCDGCQKRVCDDCASYTSDCGQEWKCSFCRRRHDRQQAPTSRMTNHETVKDLTNKTDVEISVEKVQPEKKIQNTNARVTQTDITKQDTRRNRPPVERQKKVDVPEETEINGKREEKKMSSRRSSISETANKSPVSHQTKHFVSSHNDRVDEQRHSTVPTDRKLQSLSRTRRITIEQPVEKPINQSIRTTKSKVDNNKSIQSRMFSTSESSMEEPINEDEKKRKIRTRKKTKIQKQKTDTDGPITDMDSSTETGSIFDSFDNDSRAFLTVKRRNSDSSDLSDLSGDHSPLYASRRQENRRKSLNYDSDDPYQKSSSRRYSSRLASQKSYSFENSPTENMRMRKICAEDFSIRNRAVSYDYIAAGEERRHRSLPRVPHVKPRYHDGDNIKIIIDDVDGGLTGGRHRSWEDRLNESPYCSSYRSSHSRGKSKGSPVMLSSEESSEAEMSQGLSVRRKLPKTPDYYSRSSGEISLKIAYDQTHMELVVIIGSARKLRCRRHSINPLPRAYCKLRLVPSSGHASKKTCVADPSVNPEWNNRVVFTDVFAEDLMEKSLDITVWDAGVPESHCFLGETRISLRRVDLQNVPTWYLLYTQTLLLPSYKAGSTGSLVPSTPAHDMARQLLRRGAQREMLQSRSLTDDYSYSRDDWKLVKSSSMDSTCDNC